MFKMKIKIKRGNKASAISMPGTPQSSNVLDSRATSFSKGIK